MGPKVQLSVCPQGCDWGLGVEVAPRNYSNVLFVTKIFTVDKYFLFTLLTICFPLHYSVLVLILRLTLEGSRLGDVILSLLVRLWNQKLSEMLY